MPSRFDRLFLIVELIRSRPGIKGAELAAETDVSQRTILRDIKELAARYPIVNNQGYRFLPGSASKAPDLTGLEYNALRQVLTGEAHFNHDNRSVLASVKAKIDAVVNPAVRVFEHRPSRPDSSARSKKGISTKLQMLRSLTEHAIDDSLILEVNLPSDQEANPLQLFPYALVYERSNWLMVAYLPRESKFQILRLESLRKLRLTSRHYQKDQKLPCLTYFISTHKKVEIEGMAEEVGSTNISE